MTDEMSAEQMVQSYMLSAVDASDTMFKKQLYGFYLVILYSTIDTLGLLDAPPAQVEATNSSFMAWVEKYFLPNSNSGFNALDVWAARCAVLHTFSTESGLSRKGKARQLQYFLFNGDAARDYIAITGKIDNGAHIAIHLGEFGTAFIKGMHQFVPNLLANCASSRPHMQRLRNVLQLYPMEPPPNNSFNPMPLRGTG